MMFEHCDVCIETYGKSCNIHTCKDGIRILRAVQPHSPRIRTLTRRLYEIRRCNNWMLRVDETLNIGEYDDLRRQVKTDGEGDNEKQRPDYNDTDKNIEHVVDEKAVLKEFSEQGNRFRKLINKHELFACAVCGVCRKKDNVRGFKNRNELLDRVTSESQLQKINKQKAIAMLTEWEEQYNIDIRYPGFICINFCLADLKSGRRPRMHESNGLWVDAIPNELAGLTQTELMLIQLVKCFLTLIKLKPLTKRKGPNDSVLGYRGVNVHIPLPLVGSDILMNYTLKQVL